jgi:hypothetical protein
MVTVIDLRTEDEPIVDPRRQTSLAVALREIGKSEAAKILPPPDVETRTFVQQHCTRWEIAATARYRRQHGTPKSGES